jgi:hypothetical protein
MSRRVENGLADEALIAVAVAVVAIADFVIWETTTSPDPIAAPDVQDD